MRLSKSEVERRRVAVLAYFLKNPSASVAKLNAALKSGELTGKPEKMLNIATGYKLRKEALAVQPAPEVKKDEYLTGILAAVPPPNEPTPGATLVSSDGSVIDPASVPPSPIRAIPCGDGCPGCSFCQAPSDSLPETLSEHAASIEKA
jgi:hypothetical protein